MQVLRIGDRIGEQGVTVGRGAHRIGAAEGAGAARLVLDDDVLADPFLQHRGKDARRHVGQAADCERHDHGDRPRRVVLRRRLRRPERSEHKRAEQR